MKAARIHSFGAPDKPSGSSVRSRGAVTAWQMLFEYGNVINSGQLAPRVGTLLPLNEVRTAHEMLAGAPNRRKTTWARPRALRMPRG
jgi:hypothetical protein